MEIAKILKHKKIHTVSTNVGNDDSSFTNTKGQESNLYFLAAARQRKIKDGTIRVSSATASTKT